MDDQHRLPPPANGNKSDCITNSHSYRVTNVAAGHRANHFLYGHVGRVTYISPEDDDAAGAGSGSRGQHGMGRLRTNRNLEAKTASSFHQVAPGRSWFPPAIPQLQSLEHTASLAEAKPSARSLKWLLQEAPDAVVGVAASSIFPALIRDLQASAAAQPPQTRMPLLAHGEITSLAGATPSGCAALATAVGEAGHVLRISRMRQDELAWPDQDGRAYDRGPVPHLQSTSVDTAEEGYWCAGPTAINQIKFAAQPAPTSASHPIRWVLAQTAQATFIFAPTLQKVPVSSSKTVTSDTSATTRTCGSTSCCSGFGPSYISPNPLVRISMDQTGGSPHCDVAFNPSRVVEDTDPQPSEVAIIDQGGNWTVWNLTALAGPGRQHKVGSLLQLQPVLRARGNIRDGVSPTSYWATAAAGLGNMHRILWLSMETTSSSDVRPSTVLLANAASVHVVELSTFDESDPDTTEKQTRNRLVHTLNMTRQDWTDAVLDVQRSPVHPWHVVVLTGTALVWLDLSPQTGMKRHKNGHNAAEHNGEHSRHPLVLLSCPHLRDPTDKTLKLCVTRASPLEDGTQQQQPTLLTSLAFVYSMTEPEVSLFWLTCDPTDAAGEASCQYQLFPLTLVPLDEQSSATSAHSANEPKERGWSAFVPQWTGTQTLVVLPLSVESHAGSERGGGSDSHTAAALARVPVPAGTHFFQVLAMGSNQRVCSALYASSPRLSGQETFSVPPPRPVVALEDLKRKWAKARRQIVRQAYGDSFVVPDDFSDRLLFSRSQRRPGRSAPQPSDITRGLSEQGTAWGFVTYVMPGVHALLRESLNRAIEAARKAGDPDGFAPVDVDLSPLDIIRQTVEKGFFQGGFPFTTLLDAADDKFLAAFRADQTTFAWAETLAELGYIEQGRAVLFDQMQGSSGARGVKRSPASLLEAMERLCALPMWQEEEEEGEEGQALLSALQMYRQQHTQLLAYAAVQLFLAQISMAVVPRKLQMQQRQQEQAAASLALSKAAASKRLQLGQMDRFGRLGEPLPAQSSPAAPRHRDVPDWLASSQDLTSSQPEVEPSEHDEDEDEGEDEAEEDSTIARLRQYAVSIRSEPPFIRDDPVFVGLPGTGAVPLSGGITVEDTRLLSHWPLGSDPDHFHWVPVAGGSAGAAEEALRLAALEAQEQKQRRREEKRARRERERMLMMGAVGLGGSQGSPRFSALHAPPTLGVPLSSPMPPRIRDGSQILPGSSQVLPSQNFPGASQPMSGQALSSQAWPSSSQRTAILTGGPFGNRPKKKKPKTARGLR